jgi:hypothetical protein
VASAWTPPRFDFFAKLAHDKGMRSSFIKQSIGVNPLLTARDWLIFGGIFGAIMLLWIVVAPGISSAAARGALFGAIGGGLPSLLGCLPVRGSVPAERSVSFLGRIEQAGFKPAGETAEGRIFNYKGPRWMRWDSNRIVIRTAADGALHVTAPYYFYFRLKRLQS